MAIEFYSVNDAIEGIILFIFILCILCRFLPIFFCFASCHTCSLINPYAGKGKQGAWLMRGCLEESAVKYAQIRA